MNVAQRALDSIVGRIKYYFKTNGYTKPVVIYKELGICVEDEGVDGNVVSVLNGIYRQQTSQVSVLADHLHTVTGSAILDLLVDAVPDESGAFPEVDQIVQLLHECSNDITGDWYETNTKYDGEGGNISSAVLPIVSLPTVGVYQEASSNYGAYIPVSVQLYYTAVQGAMPPSGVQLTIDGVKIPTIDLVISRTKTATTDLRANSVTSSTANTEEASTVEIQFSTPAHYFTSTDLITELLKGGTNIPHCVMLNVEHPNITGLPSRSGIYLMSFAKSQLTKTAGATIGINANLLELDTDIASASIVTPGAWQTKIISAENGSGSITIGSGDTCVYWGDGTAVHYYSNAGETVTHTYRESGTYTAVTYRWEA